MGICRSTTQSADHCLMLCFQVSMELSWHMARLERVSSIFSSNYMGLNSGMSCQLYELMELSFKINILELTLIVGKTHTLMSKDGICALVAEKLFKRIHSDKHHDYKVNDS